MDDPKTGTALVQKLKRKNFSFPVSRGVTKRCGKDFFKTEIPKEAKIRKLKQKGKGVGKKSNRNPDSSTTDHNSAQERELSATRITAQEQEVLEIRITKDETENLCAGTKRPKEGEKWGKRE